MNDLRVELDRYLSIRRSLGFKLRRPELLLRDFIRYLDANGSDTITTQSAFAWASLPAKASSEGSLGPPALVRRQGAVRQERRHPELPQGHRQLLHPPCGCRRTPAAFHPGAAGRSRARRWPTIPRDR